MPPEAAAAAQSITVLPNHDVVALGDLPLGDQMTLSAFADQSSDRVWQLTAGSPLAAIANGRLFGHTIELRGLVSIPNGRFGWRGW
jgi:hypothetical protein